MLAELAAANAAFAVIKKTISNGKEIADCASAISNFVTAKDVINTLNENIGSTGGGRDDLAQAGLEFNGKISEITATVKDNISKIILNKGN